MVKMRLRNLLLSFNDGQENQIGIDTELNFSQIYNIMSDKDSYEIPLIIR